MPGWFYRNRVISVLAVLWGMGIVTYATLRVFGVVTTVTGEVVAAYTALLGIPASVFGLWKWRNSRDESV